MSHQELLRRKDETLLRIIHPNMLLLALLTEHDWLDEFTEQTIAAERTNFDRNRRLLDWLRQSPREAFDGFLRALRTNGQGHVANYIDGTPGDLPLCDEARKRLRRIKGRVIEIMETSNKLLAYLYQEHVIGETDYHSLRNECVVTNRNAMLMDIIVRGSECGFARFCNILSSDVNQAYLVPCLERGEILPVHVTVNPADKDADIVKMLWKLVSMKDKLEELSSEERSHANDLCQQLQAVLVGARVTDSILLFAHLSMSEVLRSVREMFDSGQLIVVVRDLFRCLAKDNDLTVELNISAELFKECEDGFADDGSFHIISCCKSVLESEQHELLRLRNENCEMIDRIDDLNAQCQRHEGNWTVIDECLGTIEKDSTLSAVTSEAVQRARQCITDSRKQKNKVSWAQNVGSWLRTSVFKSTDFVDGPLPFDDVAVTDDADVGDDSASVDTGFVSDLSAGRSMFGHVDQSFESYPMRSAKRGMFVMISNENFPPAPSTQSTWFGSTQLPNRLGAHRDRIVLQQVFSQLGFDVAVHSDLTAKRAYQVLAAAGARDHSHYDCFVLAVLTHGDVGDVLFGVDGDSFKLAELMEPIKRCSSLAGKPKICIIQANRGSQLDDGVEVDRVEDKNISIPLEADQLIVHSTSEGQLSWRSSRQGSWFIQALGNELSKSLVQSGPINLAQVLTKVSHTVAYQFQSSASSAGFSDKKQVPSLYSTLTREIHLPVTASTTSTYGSHDILL